MTIPSDVLRLRNMRFFAYHGLFPEERTLGQHFEVDLELFADLTAAGQSDDLTQSYDYVRIYQLIEETVEGRQFHLVEALAEHIAQNVGQTLAPIRLTVRVRKPAPPLNAQLDGIEVELHRRYA
ncbi:MAG: dihydroneopterin aldolase [Candidatus Latescibacteria bacterium]|nr:dihydroneopterin aldolase [Candidatus Latescibacterota bacterium]